jgi:hypothetical protein
VVTPLAVYWVVWVFATSFDGTRFLTVTVIRVSPYSSIK